MAKIIKNVNYNSDAEMTGENMPYLFDAEDGSAAVGCKTWLETSKKNATHPDGKWWIKLPKDNVTNRAYYSVDLFNSTNVNGEVTVEVKTAPPRVLGSSGGVRQDIVKYLDEAQAEEYTNLVTTATEKYKAAKANNKKKKLEDMTKEELETYIECLKAGKNYVPTNGTSAKSFIDMFTDEELDRYNELLAIAVENKANTPKAKRGPLTEAEKVARKEKRQKNELSKAEKLLAALQASLGTSDEDEDESIDEDIDEEYDELIEEDDE